MITKAQENTYINKIPADTTGEQRRAAYAVIAGYRDGKTAAQIATYYSLSANDVQHWFDFFDFSASTQPSGKKRGRKSKDISSYITSKIGSIITPKTVADDLGISLPTFYNYYNSNRHMFKKVKRGEFQILDPKIQRAESE